MSERLFWHYLGQAHIRAMLFRRSPTRADLYPEMERSRAYWDSKRKDEIRRLKGDAKSRVEVVREGVNRGEER